MMFLAFTLASRMMVSSCCLSKLQVLTPAIGFGIAKLLSLSSINPDLVQGLIVTMGMPTTISSNVVFTKLAGGNEAVAVVNAVIGNLIGIFVSPAWLYLYLGQVGAGHVITYNWI